MITPIKNFADYESAYQNSTGNPEGFWAEQAEQFQWIRKWDKVLCWDFNDYNVTWFNHALLNITENCLDRHLETRGDQEALIWEPNDPSDPVRTLTYKELFEAVCRFSNVLKDQGIHKGDRVCLYMPMAPELAIAVLACARIGAIHSVVFAGFSAKALEERINDATCQLLITADGLNRGSKHLNLKAIADEAVDNCPSVEHVVVLNHTGNELSWKQGRDIWWHEAMTEVEADCPAEAMAAEDPLFILYTSGSTGKPKGVVHTCGGYMVYAAYTFRNVFQYQEHDVFWCTADIGWITGHSYIVYGPLLEGARSLMFEGIPTWPDAGRFWDVVEKHKVNIFYTAPTAIRALQCHDESYVLDHNLDSLRVLGTVGEPINEEAWRWYSEKVGRNRCPVVDTWWQTETGGILISALAGITPLKPGYASLPLPGIQPCIVDGDGNVLEGNEVEGNLCIKFPWPGMIRTTYGDHERCKSNYFSTYKGLYFTGDGCRRDADGFYRITGRVDDVINVSGHRMGTAEIEEAINSHPAVAESAVVGFPHHIKGQGIYAYCITESAYNIDEDMEDAVRKTVSEQISPIARPDFIQFVPGLPKTRSGKIMRRILRKIAEGACDNLGDISTLLDPAVVEIIKKGAKNLSQ